MDCREDLIFNDDNCRAEEKTKDSILLLKKKMLRSHELILQYNNKLKECERLKGDLGIVKEEANKLKRENNTNLSKVVKLELQSVEHKKCREDLERRLADKDIQIAGDKCHLQQLVCKVEDIEDKHSEKLMEVELEKSSLEGKVKSLEQELKALRKSHATEVTKLEKAISNVPPKTRKGAIKFVRETKEIGVNTMAEVEPTKAIIKPPTVDKCTITNEFYHITDNPYPIFCEKCESLTEPSVEKICKIMTTHPPIVTEMLSPIRRRETPRIDVSNERSKETNLNEFNRIDPISRNFVTPIDPMISNVQLTSVARPLDTSAPEIENLRRKLETLERKIKKRKKQKNLDAPPGSAGCCSYSRSANCCSFGQTHGAPVPNVFNNVQTDMMTEFWNRLMKFTNERIPKVESPRKPKKRTKVKLRRLKRNKIRNTKKLKNCGSTGWDIESEDCETQNTNNSETNHSHILRLKPSEVESKECSPVKILSDENDEFTEKGAQVENSSNRASPVKVPDKSKNKRRKRALLFSDDEDDATNRNVSSKNEVTENFSINAEFPITETEDLSIGATAPNSLDAELPNSGIPENSETAYFSENSVANVSPSISHEANSRDSNFKTALPTDESAFTLSYDSRNSDFFKAFPIRRNDKSVSVYSDADLSDAPNDESFENDLQDSSSAGKRKRSISPKATRRSTRSNLLGKLRALKKNSIMGVANTKNSTSCHETRYQRRLRNESESEEHEEKTRQTDHVASVSESEPDPRVPVKKQRIAHIPKKDNAQEEEENPRMRKLRQVVKQICQNTGKKRGRPRRSTLINSQSPLSIEQPAIAEATAESCESSKTSLIGKLDDTSLSNRLDAESRVSQSDIGDSAVIHELPKKRIKVLKNIVNDHQNNEKTMETSVADTSEKNNRVNPKLTEKVSKSIKTKVTESLDNSDANCDEINKSDGKRTLETQQNDLTRLSDTLGDKKKKTCLPKPAKEPTIAKDASKTTEQVAEVPKSVEKQSDECSASRETNKLTAACVPPTVTGETDSPASPVSTSSLEIPQMSPLEIPISRTRSPNKSPQLSIPSHAESLEEKISTNTAAIVNPTDAIALPKDFPNVTKSILFAKLTEEKVPPDVSSKNFVPPVASPADVPLSGESNDKSIHFSSHKLPAVIVARPASRLKNVKQRSLISDKVLLPSIVEASPTLPDNLATQPKETQSLTLHDRSNNEFSVPTTSASISSNNSACLPIDKPITCDKVKENSSVTRSTEESERSLIVYDTISHDNIDTIFETESVSSPKVAVDTEDAKKKKKRTKNSSNDCVGATNVVKELRSRQVLSSPATDANQRNRLTMKNVFNDETTETTVYLRGSVAPEILLHRYIGEQERKWKGKKMRKIAATKLQEASEKTVKAELEKLVESEEWTSNLHQSVVAALREVPSERMIAKCIVDLLVERAPLGEPLDRTYTPPAPVMTRTQQRIAALVNDLEREGNMPRVSEHVTDGIRYMLFRLGHAPEMDVVEALVRMFSAIARMKKDRERVRILCCDSIYCLGKKSHSIIYIVLTVWPEIFPMHGTSGGEIPNCIAHLIKCDTNFRAASAKRLITEYYKYPQIQARTSVVMTVLLEALKKMYSADLEVAILLIAKAEGTEWAHENIINGGLMTIIEDNDYSSSYDVLSLLGFILRTFPLEDAQGAVEKIVGQLLKMMENSEASPDQQEGLISALLSLSRRSSDFGKIADAVLNWKPSKKLRTRTMEQMNAFFKMRPVPWWTQRLQWRAKNNNTTNVNK